MRRADYDTPPGPRLGCCGCDLVCSRLRRDLRRGRELREPGEATHRLFVGNLSFQTRSEDLQDYFSEFGKVESATVIMNRDNPGTPLETNNLMLC